MHCLAIARYAEFLQHPELLQEYPLETQHTHNVFLRLADIFSANRSSRINVQGRLIPMSLSTFVFTIASRVPTKAKSSMQQLPQIMPLNWRCFFECMCVNVQYVCSACNSLREIYPSNNRHDTTAQDADKRG